MVEEGDYVVTPEGLGRFLVEDDNEVTVEFFDVVGTVSIVKKFSTQQVSLCDWRLFQEARTWVKQETFGWLPGRLQGLLEEDLDIKSATNMSHYLKKTS